MRRFSLFAFLVALLGVSALAQAPQGAMILVNDRPLSGALTAPQLRGQRLFLPAAAIAQALGDDLQIDSAARVIRVRRQTGVTAEFSAQLNQVRENGAVILVSSNSSDLQLPPTPEALMLPVEIISALFDVAVISESGANPIIRITRGAADDGAREGEAASNVELNDADYDYTYSASGGSVSQSATVRSRGRVGDNKVNVLVNGGQDAKRGLELFRTGSAKVERPNRQQFIAGDVGSGSDLSFLSTGLRGGWAYLPFPSARVTAFGGRTRTGSLTNPFDTNLFGAYATFGAAQPDPKTKRQFLFSSGFMQFDGPTQRGQLVAAGLRHSSPRVRFQSDFAFGDFRGMRQNRVAIEGTGLAAEMTGVFQLREHLSLQGRYGYLGEKFLTPQSNGRSPGQVVGAGMSWQPLRWVSATFSGTAASITGRNAQRDHGLSATLNLTPRGWPTMALSHTTNESSKSGHRSYTLLNATHDFKRWGYFANLSYVETASIPQTNIQIGERVTITSHHSLNITQSYAPSIFGATVGGTAEWYTSSVLRNRINFSAGIGYTRNPQSEAILSKRASASIRLPMDQLLDIQYATAPNGSQLLVSIPAGRLWRKRAVATEDFVYEMKRSGTLVGRIYQDINLNGRFDAGDKPQPNVKVRVDGSRLETSDAKGIYRIHDLHVGPHHIYIDLLSLRADLTLLGEPEYDVDVTAKREVLLDFRLVRTGRVAGLVWLDVNQNGTFDADEKPLEDVRVLTSSARDTLTAPDGSFVIGDLPPGEHTILVDEKTLPNHTEPPASPMVIKVNAGSETAGVLLRIIPSAPEVKHFGAQGDFTSAPERTSLGGRGD